MRTSPPPTVGYMDGTRFSHRQLVSPTARQIPQEQVLGDRRPHVDCNEAAIAEAIDGFPNDEIVTIAAGAMRSVFGHITVEEMGVPTEALDHHAVLCRVGAIRDVFNSTDRRRKCQSSE